MMTTLVTTLNGGTVAVFRQGTAGDIPFTTASTPYGAVFANEVRCIQMCPDQDAHFLISKAGTVVSASNGTFIPATAIVHWAVNPGETVTFIGKTASGNMNITECL